MLLRFASTMPTFRPGSSSQLQPQPHANSQAVPRSHHHYHRNLGNIVINDPCCSTNQENISSTNVSPQSCSDQQDEYFFNDQCHASQVIAGLNDLRVSGLFCDVTLCVDGEQFKCHKIVLVSCSPYFKAMFAGDLAESQQDRVSLNGIEATMMELLIKFAYTSVLLITKVNVQSLLSAANLLEMLSVRDACCRFLEKHMDVTNCVGIHCFAEAHACTDLQDKTKSFILRYFNDVIQQEEILGINEAKLSELLSNDALTVYREEDVFEAAIVWLSHDENARRVTFHNVLEHVRLPLISPYYLLDYVEEFTNIKDSMKCMELVEEAKKYHLLPDRKSEFMSVRTHPRKNAGLVEVLIAVGGEDDKVVLRSVECFDPRGVEWKNLACLPFAVSKHGLVVSGNNMLYMAGGEFPDGSASKAMWRYDPVFDAWQEMQPMNSPRSELGLAMVDGMVYAVGGWEGSCRLSSVEKYDPKTNTWTPVAPMQIAVTSPAIVSYNGHLIVTGGAILEDGDGIDFVESYDSKTNSWSDLCPMTIARSGSAACVLNHSIYVIGGWHASTENTNKVECYDPKMNEWKILNPMNERRYRPGVAVVNGRIYICGGEEGWDRYHDTIECYDDKEDRWTIVGEMTTSRSWLGCAALRLHTDCFTREKV